jgi:hypothetical protein
MPVDYLVLNNGTNPKPSATNAITLREYAGGPIPQQDAEYNTINTTDRINSLIDEIANVNASINTAENSLGARLTSIENGSTTLSINQISGLQTSLDGKVDDSQVLTNVPSGAKFTDTVYSLPVATGSTLGGVKEGGHISIDGNGLMTINSSGATAVEQTWRDVSSSTQRFGNGKHTLNKPSSVPSSASWITARVISGESWAYWWNGDAWEKFHTGANNGHWDSYYTFPLIETWRNGARLNAGTFKILVNQAPGDDKGSHIDFKWVRYKA